MITPYSYPQIVGAVTWRGLLLGAGLGAAVGTAVFPIIGTAYGALMGGIVGLVMGVVDGLYLSCVTWLCRPYYISTKFARFATISIAILTFIGAEIGFGSFFSYQYTLPFTMIASLIAAGASAWAAHRVAMRIAVGDLLEIHKRKNDELYEDYDANDTL